MARRPGRSCCQHHPPPLLALLLPLLLVLATVPESTQLQSSQTWSLLKIQQLLNYPSVLRTWTNTTDFCYSGDYKTASAFVECYADSVTQLHIIGGSSSPTTSTPSPPLPKTFSIEAFFTTLTRLPDLRVLTLTNLGLWGPLPGNKLSRLPSLEIVNVSGNYLYGSLPPSLSKLSNLQTLIADHNMLSGELPRWLFGVGGSSPSSLAVLSLRNNSFQGTIPDSVADMAALRSLALAGNSLTGAVPDLSALANLQALDLADNALGPAFPRLPRKVASVVLTGNRFGGGGIPADEVGSLYLLQRLDVSRNRFVGPIPPSLLSLPSIQFLSVAGNRFTGLLAANMSCGENLRFVDLSSNLLTGTLPSCLTTRAAAAKSDKVTVLAASNCLSGGGTTTSSGGNGSLLGTQQHPAVFCQNQALAVGIVAPAQSHGGGNAGIVAGAVAGAVALAAVVVASAFVLARKAALRRAKARPPRRLVEHAGAGAAAATATITYPWQQMMADARYIGQAARAQGALGVPAYRSFSVVELEAATGSFETARLLGQDAHGQMYRGTLANGTAVTIRSLRVPAARQGLNFNRHIEMISRLRHRHLVSALGHCFEYNLDDATVTQLYLVFEYVHNGNLRSRISQGTEGRKLAWVQRISAAIGVAKGIQFLHGGIMPGLFANNLKITNILLDQNLVAKIGSYNIPILAETAKPEGGGGSKYPSDRVPNGDKIDIYDFGVILLEIITGRPITSIHEVEIIKEQLQSALTSESPAPRRVLLDAAVSRTCSDESARTAMEICLRCLAKEPAARPSVEDVLWNLQFAAQVQDDWRAGDARSSTSEESPLSPAQIPRSSRSRDRDRNSSGSGSGSNRTTTDASDA